MIDEKIFKNYQAKYPNLAPFILNSENNTLIYEGNYLKLNGFELSRIDEVFFNLSSEDIFIFLKNGFYQETRINEQIINLANQFVITEEEEAFIKSYVNKYFIKLNLYNRNKEFFAKYMFDNENVKNYFLTFKRTSEIINDSKNNQNDVYQMINKAYNESLSALGNEQSMEQGMSLTRAKQGISGYEKFNDNQRYLEELNKKQKLSMAGFTSIVLIVSTAVAVGSYLALYLLR